MEAPLPIRVVILYVHPLLGEGLAKLLAAEPGIAASAISTDDTLGAAAALWSRPDAVIIEQRERASSPALPGNVTAPLVLFVDIAGAGGARQSTDAALVDGRSDRHGISPVTDDLERVVRAVRDLKRTRLALVSA